MMGPLNIAKISSTRSNRFYSGEKKRNLAFGRSRKKEKWFETKTVAAFSQILNFVCLDISIVFRASDLSFRGRRGKIIKVMIFGSISSAG